MITLIVPCYNEVQRLDVKSFTTPPSSQLRFLFVDDGSYDGTGSYLKKHFAEIPHCRVLQLPKNRGKGEAVRLGILEVLDSDWKNSEWLGFWDADLSTPLTEVSKFLTYAQSYGNPDAIFGSRVYRLGAHIKRSALRHYLGRVFATLIAIILKVESYDTQCGAKLFRQNAAHRAFAEPFISRWIFDVEILMRLKDSIVIEYPVEKWTDVPGSKVKIARESLRVLWDILLIRRKYFRT